MEINIKCFDDISPKEMYQLLRLRIEVFVVEQNCVYNDCDGKDLLSHHLLVKESGDIIAYLRIIPKGISYDEVSIGRVLVDKDNRSKKIATKMIVTAIEFIEQELCEDNIRILAQSHLYGFYKSFGFKKIKGKDICLEDGIPHIEMIYNKTQKNTPPIHNI